MNALASPALLALEPRLAQLEAELAALKGRATHKNAVSIVCFSGEWDKLYAAFTIACGALASGQDVHMFFTFWGATAMRAAKATTHRKTLLQRVLGWMLPREEGAMPLSRMNFGGLGRWMMGRLLREHKVDDLNALMQQAEELGAHFHCCETSLRLFGWGKEALRQSEGLDWCGVAAFLGHARKSDVTLFI